MSHMGSSAEAVLHSLHTALLVLDADGRVTVTNPPAAHILDEPEDAIVGRSIWDWFPDVPRGELALARTLREGVRCRGVEQVLTRRDGTRIPIGLSCGPLPGASGTPPGAVVTFQELSGIRRLQRQMLQAEKLASVGQLAAGVAHEINNPMGFIHANLFQIEEYWDELRRVWAAVGPLRKAALAGEPEQARAAAEHLEALARDTDVEFLLEDVVKAVRESQEGAERIRHIVQDLRSFADHGGDELMPADVNACLDSIARIVGPAMKHAVVLRKEYGDLPSIRCRPSQLKQVFMNLLVNAHQAVEERVRATGGQGTIELRTETAPGEVRVRILDDGVGLAPGVVDRIFEPFFTTRPVGEAMGLGLSTSYHIVRAHGGTIRAAPRPEGGCEVEVCLPADGPESEASA